MENVQEPADHIPAVLERVKPEYISKTYQVDTWSDAEDFLEQLAKRMGRLLKVIIDITCAKLGSSIDSPLYKGPSEHHILSLKVHGIVTHYLV